MKLSSTFEMLGGVIRRMHVDANCATRDPRTFRLAINVVRRGLKVDSGIQRHCPKQGRPRFQCCKICRQAVPTSMQMKSRFVTICDWHGSANRGHVGYAATTLAVLRGIPLRVETWLQSRATFFPR